MEYMLEITHGYITEEFSQVFAKTA